MACGKWPEDVEGGGSFRRGVVGRGGQGMMLLAYPEAFVRDDIAPLQKADAMACICAEHSLLSDWGVQRLSFAIA